VDSEGWVGKDTSLALDGGAYAHISYFGSGNLKYAYYSTTPTPYLLHLPLVLR
jgi:hypothetical protein